jgi:uncharacterized metal-binding protein
MTTEDRAFNCGDCTTLNCGKQNSTYPSFCLTESLTDVEIEEIVRIYKEDLQTASIAVASAEVAADGYGKWNRAQEIAEFTKRIGAKKVGIASCVGLIREAKQFIVYLNSQGIDNYSVLCKVGAIDKKEIGVPKRKEAHESICNPVLQARILEKEKTDLNVIIGLCVGHDALFIKYSKAPVTYLIVKDRVNNHNPAAGLASLSGMEKKSTIPRK